MNLDRRTVLLSGSFLALGRTAQAYAQGSSLPSSRSSPSPNNVQEEQRSLDELHQLAFQDGGTLTVYAGGDTSDQQDANKAAFEQAFPGVTVNIIVDYSKFHDARLDYQIATNTVVPDIVQLQTLQDFDRWKSEGVLRPYKPKGFSSIHEDFRDPDGAWIGLFVDAFSIVYNAHGVDDSAPSSLSDLLDPRWKSKIVSTYPNDDDAVLFLYKCAVGRYGWSWLQEFMKQDITWVRGTQEPADQVSANTRPIAFGTDGALAPDNSNASRFVIPDSPDPFMAWAQRAGILSAAKHPAAAELYMNWWLSEPVQKSFYMWSVREDISAHEGYKHIWEYDNANLDEFVQFMQDRDGVERFRQQITLYVGEVKGDPSPGWLGLHPGQ